MSWCILLLFFTSFQYLVANTNLTNKINNTNDSKIELDRKVRSELDKDSLRRLGEKTVSFNYEKEKAKMRNLISKNSQVILYSETQEAYEKLSKEEKFKFIYANLIFIKDTSNTDFEKTIKKVYEISERQKKGDENPFVSFINFLFVFGMIVLCIYCLCFPFITKSRSSQPVSSCPVRETNIHAPSTTVNHPENTPPPTYDNIVNNT